MEKIKNYKGTETFQLLVKSGEAVEIVNDWAERGLECDLRLRRAKTRGHVVIETRDVIFASNIQKWHPSCQVCIKE